jgi:hypothetical protein
LIPIHFIYCIDLSSVRQLIKGPTLYAPLPNEWIHEFTWHGEDGTHKTHIIPGAKKFQKLRLIPDQFYYNITDVRTADDALIVVKLMVFFELVNVETMLNNTHDPIADFVTKKNNILFLRIGYFFSLLRSMQSVQMSLHLHPFENTKHFLKMPIN